MLSRMFARNLPWNIKYYSENTDIIYAVDDDSEVFHFLSVSVESLRDWFDKSQKMSTTFRKKKPYRALFCVSIQSKIVGTEFYIFYAAKHFTILILIL